MQKYTHLNITFSIFSGAFATPPYWGRAPPSLPKPQPFLASIWSSTPELPVKIILTT